MEANTSVALPLVLALELVEGQTPARFTLDRDEADALAALVATDLHELVPKIGAARLSLAGSLLDSSELLRPGFPAWATLDELSRRVPRGHLENVVAFGSHDGQMPAPVLEPAMDFATSPMRLLPMSLLTPPELAEELAEYLEVQLIGRGEAGAATADWVMRTLGVKLAHVRYLSRNDLLAVVCAQYENVNLAALWQLLEVALLTPTREEEVLSARGLGLAYVDGHVLAQSPAQWLAAQEGEDARRAHDFAGILFELRQYAVLLDAHHLPLQLDGGEPGHGYLLETLAAPDPRHDAPALFAHEAPGLGTVAITVAQHDADGNAVILAHGYPLRPTALGPLLALLADRYAIPSELNTLGRVWLAADGSLGAPAIAVH